MLPIHFGSWHSVYDGFHKLARRFLFQTIHDVELTLDRQRDGREANGTAAVMARKGSKLCRAAEASRAPSAG